MSLVQQLIAAIRAAMGTVHRAQASITTARTHGDEAILLIQQTTDGTSDPRPAEAVMRLQQAQERLDEAATELSAGTHALDEYITNGLGGDAATVVTGPSTPSRQSATSPQQQPFKPMRTDPVKRDEVKPYVGLDYAVATLWDADGNRILGPHEAADDGPAATANWRPPWRDFPRLRRHVEAHAAARMQRDGHRELAMYINMKPCSYPDGCKANIRALIPKGSTLFVHQVFSDGSTKIHPFPGTGQALRSNDGYRV